MSDIGTQPQTELKKILEAILLASGEPMSVPQLESLFEPGQGISASEIQGALDDLTGDLETRGIELVEAASGYRLQTRQELQPWISRLWEERPQRYSRALLETLSLIAYRQPITRGEIEEVRGVSVSSSIVRTLQEREWIRVIGHRDVPGKPALFGTTKAFLDYFNLKSLDDLPSLAEIKDMESLEPEFEFKEDPLKGAVQDPAPDTNESDAKQHPDRPTTRETDPSSGESDLNSGKAPEDSTRSEKPEQSEDDLLRTDQDRPEPDSDHDPMGGEPSTAGSSQ